MSNGRLDKESRLLGTSIHPEKQDRKSQYQKKQKRAKKNFVISEMVKSKKVLVDGQIRSNSLFEKVKRILDGKKGFLGKKILLAIVMAIAVIVQLFVSFFIAFLSLFFPIFLVILVCGIFLFTVASVAAYALGFFGIDGAEGVIQVTKEEINIYDKANELYSEFEQNIDNYVKTVVTKDTEMQKVTEKYVVCYPKQEIPDKNALLSLYFSKIADFDMKNIANDEYLPYLNVNTDDEKQVLEEMFQNLNYCGQETVETQIVKEVIGYEKKLIRTMELAGYQQEEVTHSIEANMPIFLDGCYADSSKANEIYVKVNKTADYNRYVQLEDSSIRSGSMYAYLHTSSENKIPMGTQLIIHCNQDNQMLPIQIQIVGMETSGNHLYDGKPWMELFTMTTSKLEFNQMNEVLPSLLSMISQEHSYHMLYDMVSCDAYEYHTIREVPVWREVIRYEEDYSKPIYRELITKIHTLPVYYLAGETWYENNQDTLSDNQKEVYQEVVEVMKEISY